MVLVGGVGGTRGGGRRGGREGARSPGLDERGVLVANNLAWGKGGIWRGLRGTRGGWEEGRKEGGGLASDTEGGLGKSGLGKNTDARRVL